MQNAFFTVLEAGKLNIRVVMFQEGPILDKQREDQKNKRLNFHLHTITFFEDEQ